MGTGGHGAVRHSQSGKNQRHQRLRRLAGLVEFLRPHHPQPPRSRGLAGVQRGHRPDADGAGRVRGDRGSARPLRQYRHRLDRCASGRPGDQQAAGPVAEIHRVQARAPLRHQPGGRRRHADRLPALGARPRRPVRRPGASGLASRGAGLGIPAGATAGLAHRRALLHRPRTPAAPALPLHRSRPGAVLPV